MEDSVLEIVYLLSEKSLCTQRRRRSTLVEHLAGRDPTKSWPLTQDIPSINTFRLTHSTNILNSHSVPNPRLHFQQFKATGDCKSGHLRRHICMQRYCILPGLCEVHQCSPPCNLFYPMLLTYMTKLCFS